MSTKTKRWARANGFAFDRSKGAWTDAEGRMLALCSGRWRVLTRGGGFHPTMAPDA